MRSGKKGCLKLPVYVSCQTILSALDIASVVWLDEDVVKVCLITLLVSKKNYSLTTSCRRTEQRIRSRNM